MNNLDDMDLLSKYDWLLDRQHELLNKYDALVSKFHSNEIEAAKMRSLLIRIYNSLFITSDRKAISDLKEMFREENYN